jgi:predicted DCC family thiol-disulfide oxidoreductase YuxK
MRTSRAVTPNRTAGFEPFRAVINTIGLLQNTAESGFILRLAGIYSTHAGSLSFARACRSPESCYAKSSSVPVYSGAVSTGFLLNPASRGFLSHSRYDDGLNASDTRSTHAPVVLFDGVCNLCNGSVQFIITHDPAAHFRFAALESEAARRLLGECELSGPLPDSVALVEGGSVYTRSTAALRIARRLAFPCPLLYALIVVPRPLRDVVYNLIARNRYRWFGKRDACMVPTRELRARFLV